MADGDLAVCCAEAQNDAHGSEIASSARGSLESGGMGRGRESTHGVGGLGKAGVRSMACTPGHETQMPLPSGQSRTQPASPLIPMKKLLLLVFLATAIHVRAAEMAGADGFIPLFDGKS